MAAATAAPLDEGTAKKVLRQVEFYFSDSNLPRDKFLRETVEQSDDGLVSLPLICSFSRMKSHLGLGADVKAETLPEETVLAVAEVLRRSQVLRVSEDGKKIGRATELSKPDEIIEQVDSRTVAVSPLPYNVKLEDVQSFFTNYAKVNSVRLPRNIVNKKHFCGTALVEFSEEEEAKSIMEKDNALVFAGANLEIRPKKEFDAKQESKKEAYEKALPRKDNQDEGYPKGLIVAFKLKKTTVDSVVQQDNIDEGNDSATKLEVSSSVEKLSGEGPESTLESDDTKQGKSSDDMAEEKELNTAEVAESEKCIGDAQVESDKHGDSETLSRDGKNISGNVNVKSQISREDLKEAFKKFGTVRYVDFSIGDNSGYLRFEDSNAAEKARMSAVLADEGGLIIKHHIVTLEPVTGEAEKDYWNTIRGIQGKYKDNKGYKGRYVDVKLEARHFQVKALGFLLINLANPTRDFKNQRGGKHFNGKRDRNPDSEKNSNKAQKVEAAA